MTRRESSRATGQPSPRDGGAEETVEIREGTIRLGQLLKLASLVDDGVEAAELIRHGLVKVNGEIEERRGRQLGAGDSVEVNGRRVRLATHP
ncbi:RNA-binding S4 domain-containing protein [Sinomonas atrocyanea]|jgi:ribosome-associated protein|uniref:RNA-binding S4 domain-containing protein n=1 Tax=Sinomonas atrocyanea TaxID=37927 RepID=UPI002784CEEF|nr:RNA-binding S4 domain-containing protein [Sinomonas atrocyanea]MDQ0259769.1 ribosome-associated protein [Sinomonas atrocyanea]MDR6621734.1 ribosome-associated protein [Sinomonas atrocyanea]